jgi:lipopolysaccharide transport system ATP-binding protein
VRNVSKIYQLGELGTKNYKKDLFNGVSSIFHKSSKPKLEVSKNVRDKSPEMLDHVWALKDINFDIQEGEAVGIVGRNGAGKSTLLKILSRITKPSSGDIKLCGRVGSLLEVGTGFHPELTGRENIFLNGAILGMSKRDISLRLDEIISFSGVERYLDTPVKRYSSGMKVRLGFAVAAHLEPEILIVDEVLAVGDYLFQKKCLGKLESVGKEGRTVIFVSHNLNLVNKFCSRALLIEDGELVKDGSVPDVIDQYVSSSQLDSDGIYINNEKSLKTPVYVKKAKLYSFDNKSTSKIKIGNNAVLLLEYFFEVPVTGCHLALIVTDRLNNHVFSIADSDLDKSKLEMERKGGYGYRVELPIDILNEGEYTLACGIGIPGGKIYFREELFDFSIIGVMSNQMNVEGGKRSGLLYLKSNFQDIDKGCRSDF